jgi:hypothetical protein
MFSLHSLSSTRTLSDASEEKWHPHKHTLSYTQAKPRNIRLLFPAPFHVYMTTRNGTIRSTIKGLHFVSGLCDGVLTGAEASAGFPSLLCAKENETTNGTRGSGGRSRGMILGAVAGVLVFCCGN